MLNKLFTFIVLLVISTAFVKAQDARVQVIHNSALPAAAEVDVYINGNKPDALDDFAFRTATPFVDLPSGVDIEVTIAAPTSMDVEDGVINTFNLGQLEAGGTYVVVANGILGDGFTNPDEMRDINFQLYALPGKESADEATNVDLNIFHGATDAPAVDIYADINQEPLVPNLDYAASTGYVGLPAASYTLTITAAGNPEVVAGVYNADLTALAGGAATVFASGFLSPNEQTEDVTEDYSFGIYAALPDGTVIALPSAAQSVNEQLIEYNLNIYPTPSNDFVYITNDMADIENVKVYDMQGQIATQALIYQQDANTFVIETRALSTGVYYLQINGINYNQMEQIIIER